MNSISTFDSHFEISEADDTTYEDQRRSSAERNRTRIMAAFTFCPVLAIALLIGFAIYLTPGSSPQPSKETTNSLNLSTTFFSASAVRESFLGVAQAISALGASVGLYLAKDTCMSDGLLLSQVIKLA